MLLEYRRDSKYVRLTVSLLIMKPFPSVLQVEINGCCLFVCPPLQSYIHTLSHSFFLLFFFFYALFPSIFISPLLSVTLKHILLLPAALSYKHASTHPWKKKYDVGRGEGGEMHELSFNKGERQFEKSLEVFGNLSITTSWDFMHGSIWCNCLHIPDRGSSSITKICSLMQKRLTLLTDSSFLALSRTVHRMRWLLLLLFLTTNKTAFHLFHRGSLCANFCRLQYYSCKNKN